MYSFLQELFFHWVNGFFDEAYAVAAIAQGECCKTTRITMDRKEE
jgi:hypothetical protein